MFTFSLPNGAHFNVDLLVDSVVEHYPWPQTYLDTRTGAVISIANPEGLEAWIKTGSTSEAIIHLEAFSPTDKLEYAKDFVDIIAKDELSKRELATVNDLIRKGDYTAFENYLEDETDGLIYAWISFIEDSAHEYVTQWLLNNPKVKITQKFEGCGNCEVCKAMKENPEDMQKLIQALQTEETLQSVEKQVKIAAKAADIIIREEPKQAFVFKISLNDSRPLIWRRIVVPENYTFFELHCAIQDAIGWMDGHMHDFRITDTKSGKTIREGTTVIALPDPEFEPTFTTKNEREELLNQWFGVKMKQCVYTYDFGDNWDHTILLEKVVPYDTYDHYPQCLAGAEACPPEDCGGLGGYDRIQKIVKNKKHPEHKEVLEWLDLDSATDFDPHHFDPKEVDFIDPNQVWAEYQKFRNF